MGFTYEQKVQWVDTDAAGITHFTAAFRYAEAAEVAYFEHLGKADVMRLAQAGYALERVHVEADYHRPFRFGDVVRVRVRPLRVGGRSLSLAFAMDRTADPPNTSPAVEVRMIVALVDLHLGRSVPWPDDIRSLLETETARAHADGLGDSPGTAAPGPMRADP